MKVFEQASARAEKCASALDHLRDYLDTIRFHQFFQYLAGINNYALTPSVFTHNSRQFMLQSMNNAIHGSTHTFGLIRVLCAAEPTDTSALYPQEQALAEILVNAGLLIRKDDRLINAGLQLISSHGCYLFIDTRIHFSDGRVHEVYIGVDSYLLLFYLDTLLLPGTGPFLDLCSGSGIIGQAAATRGLQVISTDIAPEPLFFILINRQLNKRETSITVREERLEQSLNAPAGSYRYIVCNPPFVAFPPGVNGPIYAKGTDPDGLGMLRMLFDQGPDALTDDGLCCFVADLPGNEIQPHYIRELQTVAKKKKLQIDVFIDNRLPAKCQVDPLAGFMKLCNPDRTLDELRTTFQDFIKNTLQATHYYLCTMLASRNTSHPHVRVLNRYQTSFAYEFFQHRTG